MIYGVSDIEVWRGRRGGMGMGMGKGRDQMPDDGMVSALLRGFLGHGRICCSLGEGWGISPRS